MESVGVVATFAREDEAKDSARDLAEGSKSEWE